MKERDKKILNLLQQNARLTFKQISEKINVPASTIHFRVKKMLEEGLIKRFSVIIDLEKAGYEAIAWVGLNVDPLKIKSVSKRLTQFDNILKVFSTTGDHDLIIQVISESEKSLWRFLKNKVQIIDGVSPDMHVSLILDIFKWVNSIKL
jgi:Lrp/AsnC family transcriptional regulator for asnA, asnC and gidA